MLTKLLEQCTTVLSLLKFGNAKINGIKFLISECLIKSLI